MIVKTDGYTRDQVGKVIQVRATVEGLKLGEGVIDRLAGEGEKRSLRYGAFLGLKFVLIAFTLDMHCSCLRLHQYWRSWPAGLGLNWRISVR
jgi:DNA helicase TIP49 (TBP-interacting protein)